MSHEPTEAIWPIDSELAPSHDDDTFQPEEVANDPEYRTLFNAVLARVKHHFTPVGVPTSQNHYEAWASLICEDLEFELDKYAKGQAEHGGDLRDRDLDADMKPEMADLTIYNRAKKLQRSYVKLSI